MNLLELREIQALNTLVFETLGQPEKEREFKFKSLKRWGLDLILGKKGGEETYFVAEYGKRKKGDVYEEEGVEYLVQGTIAPDWIESGDQLRDTIKSHHNVGGLPERMNLKLIEPL